MANEQNTEALTRKNMHFDVGDNETFTVYAQSIDRSLTDISTCLTNAGGKPKEFSLDGFDNSSYNPKGKAKPEYIITYKNDPSTILVIECKSNIKMHSSRENITNSLFPKNYAIDGVLYYSYFLKEKFNVIALAISGNEKNYKVNEYYWVKGQPKPIEQERTRNTFLTPQNYKDLIDKKKLVKKFSYIEIKEKAIEFNEHLRTTLKIEPTKRIMFIAGCLLALKDTAFQNTYSSGLPTRMIINQMTSSIKQVLTKHKIPQNKIDLITKSCSFIEDYKVILETDPQCQGSLLYFLKQLDLCIIPMINDNTNHQDSLGLFYHEFIKYTAGGTGNELGIVLTPPHLCDFMCELAEIGKNDYVLDTCCGTGSFLISAMKHMFVNANENEISEIKKNQLYGIETTPDIFTIAVTNMIIRGDGQSHIFNVDCFKLTDELKDVQFNIGLINPPYSQKDHSELEFVNTMLNYLSPKGRGVVVVPMSCAIGTKFKEIREKLFETHTLKAVFSMPDDIFYPVGTNVCVMVWEAHVPHDSSKKTYFGYYKDDGFKKKKKLGRVDYFDKWKDIKKEWISNYQEKKVLIGQTTLKNVKHSDEWLCEAYMDTDYSILNNKHFFDSIDNFLAFLIKEHRYKDYIIENNTLKFFDLYLNKLSTKELKIHQINTNDWSFFSVQKLFECKSTKMLVREFLPSGNIPFISRSAINNGCDGFVKKEFTDDYLTKGNCITVGAEGIYAFYQVADFVTGNKVYTLNSKHLNIYIALFIITILNLEYFRYSYGRARIINKLKEEKIKLPIKHNLDGTPFIDTNKTYSEEGYVPDFKFMEEYIKSLPYGDRI